MIRSRLPNFYIIALILWCKLAGHLGTCVHRAMARKPKCILQCSCTHTSGMQQVHRSYMRVCGRQVHSRACHCVHGILSLFLSLLFSPFTLCSSLRFLLSRSQELVVISVLRALPYFLWDWQNASQREQVRDSSSDERKIVDYSPRLLHGSSTDRQDERWENLISNIHTQRKMRRNISTCENVLTTARKIFHKEKILLK